MTDEQAMHDSQAQLTDALTAQFVSVRTTVEALLNRVTSIVTAEQVERLKLQEQFDQLMARLTELEAYTHAATEQRAHLLSEIAMLRTDVQRAMARESDA